MEPAPELVAFAERMLNVLATMDSERWVDAFDRHSGVLFIGPDPDEWCQGIEKIKALATVQFGEMKELGNLRVEAEEIVAWREGSVGWISIRGRIAFGSGELSDTRLTFIVHEDGAFWRIVHHQVAFSVSNEEAIGFELTTAVEELLLLVQDVSPPAAGMSADGSVTILFTDLESSTVLMESLGEERWLELLAWHDTIVKQQTAIFGGIVVKGQGDGFMLAFPAAGSATACASAIQRTLSNGWSGVPVLARIGLHTGNAKAEGGDFFGRTVVVAARVSSVADGGQILLSQSTQEDLNGVFPLKGPKLLALKGLSGMHSIFELNWK
jgi:class 3 adenylate cyclase